MKFKYPLLIFTGLILGLVICELTLHFYQFLGSKKIFGLTPIFTTITWQNDLSLGRTLLTPFTKGWFVTPSKEYFNWVEANSQGFFDSEHEFKKAQNVYRIVILGDSFVASLQTPKDQTIGKLIENKLNAKSQKKFEVISIGLGDSGTAEQYLALKYLIPQYNPDLVIHMFLSANDIKNNSPSLQNDPYRPYLLLDRGKLELVHPQKRQELLFKKVLKNLYLSRTFLSIRQQHLEQKIIPGLDYPIDYYVYNKNYTKEYTKAWEITKAIILEAKKLTELKKEKYLFVTAANNEQISHDVWYKLQQKYPKLKNQTDLEKPDQIINKFCKDKELNCFFMLPYFKLYINNHPNERTHYKLDGHWNALGTSLAAQFLTDHILNFIKNK